MQIIFPKVKVSVPLKTPLFFLGGPILGALDWQEDMCHILAKRVPNCFIATPRRYEETHRLRQYAAPGRADAFEHQLTWERYYLTGASEGPGLGCVLFWLCKEDFLHPRSDGNPYAMDTRGELGEFRGRMMLTEGLRVVFGAEQGFPGLDQIRRNFDLALGRKIRFYTTMEDLADRAVKRAV